jgi:hypothetical protein
MKNLSNENSLLLERRYKEAALLSLSSIVFVILVVLMSNIPDVPIITIEKQGTDSLWVLVIFLAGGAILIKRLLNNWDRIKDVYLLQGMDGAFRKLKKDAFLISLFGMGAALCGVVIFLSSGSRYDLFRAVAVSLVVMLAGFPRKKIWKRIAGELEGV